MLLILYKSTSIHSAGNHRKATLNDQHNLVEIDIRIWRLEEALDVNLKIGIGLKGAV